MCDRGVYAHEDGYIYHSTPVVASLANVINVNSRISLASLVTDLSRLIGMIYFIYVIVCHCGLMGSIFMAIFPDFAFQFAQRPVHVMF